MNPRKPDFSRFILLFFFFLCCYIVPTIVDAYEGMDPKGNITVKWDITQWGQDVDTYVVVVSILNYQLFRPVEKPGWKLQWDWQGDEVIWNMQGAEAKEQGNCQRVKRSDPPHCCKTTPEIIDLLPDARGDKRFTNCCRGGALSTMKQDPAKWGSMFKMTVEGPLNTTTLPGNDTALAKFIPRNFSLGLPGYSCSDPKIVTPSKFPAPDPHSQHWDEAFLTWNITCSYAQTRTYKPQTCCVSLSAFYNDTITQCNKCDCACQEDVKCVKEGQTPEILKLPHREDELLPPQLRCTRHMCPVLVHWHVKTSYRQYWRVKITIHNFDYVRNYSQWTLVAQHPDFRSLQEVHSFKYKPLNPYGSHINDTAMFWGIPYYNEMLLGAGKEGNVQTEILIRKEHGFTFRNGWAFPRQIAFNGQQCIMPQADDYPRLPNKSSPNAIARPSVSSVLLLLTLMILVHGALNLGPQSCIGPGQQT